MELHITERLAVLSILPATGSFINLKLLREAREMLSFTDKEYKEFNLVEKDDTLSWALPEGVSGFADIELGAVVTGMIRIELERLNTEEMLDDRYFTIYEKFM